MSLRLRLSLTLGAAFALIWALAAAGCSAICETR